MFKVGDILLIEFLDNSKYIRIVKGITKAGSFKTNDFIINKTGKIRGHRSAHLTVITEEEAQSLNKEWKEQRILRKKLRAIFKFNDWHQLPKEIIDRVYALITKKETDSND